MPLNKKVILICTPLRFYTHNDEELFFSWLKKIPSIRKLEGIGRELHLHISSKNIPNPDLLDLIGIFERYKFDASQLYIFMNESNKEWFNQKTNDH